MKSCARVAQELGITRQAVHQNSKSAMKKIYNNMFKYNLADTPFEAVMNLMIMLGLDKSNEEDIKDFYTMFPDEIKKEVLKSANSRQLQ